MLLTLSQTNVIQRRCGALVILTTSTSVTIYLLIVHEAPDIH